MSCARSQPKQFISVIFLLADTRMVCARARVLLCAFRTMAKCINRQIAPLSVLLFSSCSFAVRTNAHTRDIATTIYFIKFIKMRIVKKSVSVCFGMCEHRHVQRADRISMLMLSLRPRSCLTSRHRHPYSVPLRAPQ